MYDLLLRNGRVVDPSIGLDGVSDIAVENGVIARVAPGIAPAEAARVIEVGGKIVTPGLWHRAPGAGCGIGRLGRASVRVWDITSLAPQDPEAQGRPGRGRTALCCSCPSLKKDAPDGRPIEPSEMGKVVQISEVGGLHHSIRTTIRTTSGIVPHRLASPPVQRFDAGTLLPSGRSLSILENHALAWLEADDVRTPSLPVSEEAPTSLLRVSACHDERTFPKRGARSSGEGQALAPPERGWSGAGPISRAAW